MAITKFLTDMDRLDRILYGTIGVVLLGTVFFVVAVCLPNWVHLTIPQGEWRNMTQAYVINHRTGLWRICRTEVDRVMDPTESRKYIEAEKDVTTTEKS